MTPGADPPPGVQSGPRRAAAAAGRFRTSPAGTGQGSALDRSLPDPRAAQPVRALQRDPRRGSLLTVKNGGLKQLKIGA